jgi:hypothetical protein
MRATLHEPELETMGMLGVITIVCFRFRFRSCDRGRVKGGHSGKNILRFLGIALLAAITGCQSPRPVQGESSSTHSIRNNAASLLYQLLDEEADVAKLLIIKRDRAELHRVIKSISIRAKEGHQQLARLASEDSTLDLKHTNLPPGDKAARDAISKKRAGDLLRASGAEFEFKLLLTQVEALGYAEHLAKVAALDEPNAAHARTFTDIATQMHQSYEEVIALLKAARGNAAR